MRCSVWTWNACSRNLVPVLVGLCGLLLTGCVSTYTGVSANVQSSYRSGNVDQALQTVQAFEGHSRNRPLVLLEKGNLLLSKGKVGESGAAFAALIDPMIREEDNRPVIDLSGLGGQVEASTFGDDRSLTYQVQGFELVMAMQYRALAFLFQGNLDSAVVEMRRAARIQDSIRSAYKQEAGNTGAEQAALEDRVAEVMNRMEPLLSPGGNSWSNAGVWWLSGVLREVAGEPSVAQIDFQRALELQPGNPVFLQELMRLMRENDPSRYQALAAEFPEVSKALPDPGLSSSVIVLYEEGLAPLMIADTVFFYWTGLHTINISVPYMVGPMYSPGTARVRTETATTELKGATSVQSLSAHALEERMPGIMWRNILRNITRATLNEASEEGNENWEAAIKIFLLIKGAAEEADTRFWSTLPLGMQTARLWLPPGEHKVWVETPGGSVGPYTFQLEPGRHGVIFLRDTGGYSAWYQGVFPGQGPARFGTGSPQRLSDPPLSNPNEEHSNHESIL